MIKLTIYFKNGFKQSTVLGDSKAYILGFIAKVYKADKENLIENISIVPIDILKVV
jgi:hypothetical protein